MLRSSALKLFLLIFFLASPVWGDGAVVDANPSVLGTASQELYESQYLLSNVDPKDFLASQARVLTGLRQDYNWPNLGDGSARSFNVQVKVEFTSQVAESPFGYDVLAEKTSEGTGLIKIVIPEENLASIAKVMEISLVMDRISNGGIRVDRIFPEWTVHLANEVVFAMGVGQPNERNLLLYDYSNSNTPYASFLELFWNAKQGGVQSEAYLTRIYLEISDLVSKLVSSPEITPLLGLTPEAAEKVQKRFLSLKEVYAPLLKRAKREYKNAQALYKAKEPIRKAYEAREDSLLDLIAANDRAAVKQVLKDLVPWDLMEPAHKTLWKAYVEGLDTPPNLQTSTIYFRGLSGDRIYDGRDSGHFVLAPVLTKNQGSWWRRLRSLATSLYKIGTASQKMSASSDPPSLVRQMTSHAGNPFASPFFSVSNLKTARNFSEDYKSNGSEIVSQKIKLAAIALSDPLINVISTYGESERLPLITTFPDQTFVLEIDTINFPGGNLDPQVQVKINEWLTEIEQKIGRPLTAKERGEELDATYFEEGTRQLISILCGDAA